MPTLRSAFDRSAAARFVFRSELPVPSLFAMVPFVRAAFTIRRSLDALVDTDGGLLHYELVADLRRKRFTVDSSWASEHDFAVWVRAEPHRSVMASLGPRVEGATFHTETRPGSESPTPTEP